MKIKQRLYPLGAGLMIGAVVLMIGLAARLTYAQSGAEPIGLSAPAPGSKNASQPPASDPNGVTRSDPRGGDEERSAGD